VDAGTDLDVIATSAQASPEIRDRFTLCWWRSWRSTTKPVSS